MYVYNTHTHTHTHGVCLVQFLADILARSLVQPNYRGRFSWWLEVLGKTSEKVIVQYVCGVN